MPSELLLSRFGGRTWAALREDGHLVELRVEREGEPLSVGHVVKGRVAKVLPGLQAAFVEVGPGKHGFLHASDLILPGEEALPPAEREAVDPDDEPAVAALEGELSAERARACRAAPIQDRLREGRELVVQVTKAPLSTKGARVSCHIALPGRYLVYLPLWSQHRISRRVEDAAERERLRDALERLPFEGGFIARTAAQGIEPAVIEADAARLALAWRTIESKAALAPVPSLLHADLDLPLRILRDLAAGEVDEIVLDDPALHAAARDYLVELAPALVARLRLHTGPETLLRAYGVDEEMQRALKSRVWLRSGGYIVLEQTEALVSIDVNSGKYIAGREPEQTVLRTNLEAAREIARQIRLRDLSGILVVDFIDMELEDSRRQVIGALEDALKRDRTRTQIVGLGSLGLLVLTRKRTRPALHTMLTRSCPACGGRGRVKTPEAVVAEVLGRLGRRVREESTALTIRVHPDVAPALLEALPTAFGPSLATADRVRVEAAGEVHPERYEIRSEPES